jgi:peptidoglycan/xylan/chitin deacetylase (PgdA/CDA1 family)
MRRAAQKAMLKGLRLTRLHKLLGRPGRGAVLTLHRVRPARASDFAPNAHLEVTPQFLGAAVDWIRGAGIDIVDLDEALRRVATPTARRFAVITFDDGYRDNLHHALPVLKARHAPFTVFVCSGFIDRFADPWWMTLEELIARSDSIVAGPGGVTHRTKTAAEKSAAFNVLVDWFEALPQDEQRSRMAELAHRHEFDIPALLDAEFMNWDEVRRLAAEPLVMIGGHTINHYALAQLPEGWARKEITGGMDRLSAELGRRPRHFAYPYGYPGAVGEREYDMAAELGIGVGVRTTPGVLTERNAQRSTAWPRISLNGLFQDVRYLEVLLSGAPFVATELIARLRGSRPTPPARPAASPSSGRSASPAAPR